MSGNRTVKIALRDVEKRFISSQGQEQVALTGVNLDIIAGEVICLVGPSGCGKSTLINLMAGFEQPSSGSVTIDGVSVTGPDPDHIMIFQAYGLFPWRTVLDNVLFGLRAKGLPTAEAREKARRALDLVGLRQSAGKHPHELSGGMQQRVAIARALAVEPSVLFMDEPFGALDTFTRLHLQDELLRIHGERKPTVVFVTHDLDEAIALGQRVVLMAPNPGRIQRILDVRLPYPRERSGGNFAAFRRELYEEFHLVHQQAEQGIEYVI